MILLIAQERRSRVLFCASFTAGLKFGKKRKYVSFTILLTFSIIDFLTASTIFLIFEVTNAIASVTAFSILFCILSIRPVSCVLKSPLSFDRFSTVLINFSISIAIPFTSFLPHLVVLPPDIAYPRPFWPEYLLLISDPMLILGGC